MVTATHKMYATGISPGRRFCTLWRWYE